MAAKITAIRAKPAQPPQQPDERAELRAAIQRADEARRALDRHKAAIQTAKYETVPAAEAALKKLQASEADAKEKLSEELAVKLGGTVGRKPPSNQMRPELFEPRLREAEDRVATARGALAHLQNSLGAAEDALALAEAQVLIEVNTLLAPVVARFLAEAEEHRRKFVQMRAALRALAADFNPLPNFSDAEAVASLRAQSTRFAALGDRDAAELFGKLGMYHTTTEDAEVEFQIPALWRQAKEALRMNADSELPPI